MRRRPLTDLALIALLATGCGGSSEGETAQRSIEVGDGFEWNGFTVANGWSVETEATTITGEPFQQAVVEGEVTNETDSSRFAVFQIAFGRAGEQISEVNCTSEAVEPDQSVEFRCGGAGQPYPDSYDSVVVRAIER